MLIVVVVLLLLSLSSSLLLSFMLARLLLFLLLLSCCHLLSSSFCRSCRLGCCVVFASLSTSQGIVTMVIIGAAAVVVVVVLSVTSLYLIHASFVPYRATTINSSAMALKVSGPSRTGGLFLVCSKLTRTLRYATGTLHPTLTFFVTIFSILRMPNSFESFFTSKKGVVISW